MEGAYIHVRVTTAAKKQRVTKQGEGRYAVHVKAPAKEGRANEEVLALLSHGLKVPQKRLRLVRGHTTPHKLFLLM